ncbi:MAG: hypothetical protein JO056_08210 [Alphaproteobacteria bacterium]|nr:hypothetical protein [Alphaproteobacteria bacterium]
MRIRLASLAMLATSVAALTAFSASADQANQGVAKPLFGVIPANAPGHAATDKIVRLRKPAAQISQWNGSFVDLHGTRRTFTMIGPDPTRNNATTTIPFQIVPVIMTYTLFGNQKFDPTVDQYSDGETVMQNFQTSPLLTSDIDFKSGGVDLGNTQYIDAYQRGNFYKKRVKKGNTNYHVVLGSPTVLAPLNISVGAGQGVVETNPFGAQLVGTYGFGAMDSKITGYISTHSEITPDKFVFFVTHNVFLTSGGCCIGGYHSATHAQPGGQTYGYTTFITESGSFSQDVSAASHEIGEWMDDPFIDNRVGCTDNSILENGDPLVGKANYGSIHYLAHGFNYDLQDLVYLGYFGAPRNTSVNKLLSFNQLEQSVCPGQ